MCTPWRVGIRVVSSSSTIYRACNQRAQNLELRLTLATTLADDHHDRGAVPKAVLERCDHFFALLSNLALLVEGSRLFARFARAFVTLQS